MFKVQGHGGSVPFAGCACTLQRDPLNRHGPASNVTTETCIGLRQKYETKINYKKTYVKRFWRHPYTGDSI